MTRVGQYALALAALLLASTYELASAEEGRSLMSSGVCKGFSTGQQILALAVADPGDFTGSAEDKYYIANLKNILRLPTNATSCGSKTFGTLVGQRVVLVTTGIGPLNAAVCITELLQCRKYISALVFSGTAGYSSQIGGVLNADGSVNRSPTVLRLGATCVSPFSVNWDCQQVDWTQACAGYPNVDSLPTEFYGPEAGFLYGQCIFSTATQASTALTDEILKAARANAHNGMLKTPTRFPNVQFNENIYFNNMSKGTGTKYTFPDSALVQIYDYNQCTEVDGQFFYSGVPWDMLARSFVAETLNVALGTSKTRRDVIAVSAEEAVGVTQAMQSYNRLASSTLPPLPYTFVRANSDWLHAPVVRGPGRTWRQIDQTRDFVTGYAYAIASYSTIVLSWLQSRCLKLVAEKAIRGPASTVCTYAVNYTGTL